MFALFLFVSSLIVSINSTIREDCTNTETIVGDDDDCNQQRIDAYNAMLDQLDREEPLGEERDGDECPCFILEDVLEECSKTPSYTTKCTKRCEQKNRILTCPNGAKFGVSRRDKCLGNSYDDTTLTDSEILACSRIICSAVDELNCNFEIMTPTKFCSTPVLPIVDNTIVEDDIIVNGLDNYCNVNLKIDLDICHTWTGDLIINLEHNDNDIGLWFNQCGSSDNMLIDIWDFNNIFENLCLANGGPPIQGQCRTDTFVANSFHPVLLSGDTSNNFRDTYGTFGGDLNGEYTLQIADLALGDDGTLNEWCLEFQNEQICNVNIY